MVDEMDQAIGRILDTLDEEDIAEETIVLFLMEANKKISLELVGEETDLDRLRNLGEVIKDTSLCGLGQSSPNPVLSTLDNFYDEYYAHVVDKKCQSGVCTDLLEYFIVEENCIGCTACARVCPVECISGKVKEVHVIDEEKCIACGACYDACKFDAVIKP